MCVKFWHDDQLKKLIGQKYPFLNNVNISVVKWVKFVAWTCGEWSNSQSCYDETFALITTNLL